MQFLHGYRSMGAVMDEFEISNKIREYITERKPSMIPVGDLYVSLLNAVLPKMSDPAFVGSTMKNALTIDADTVDNLIALSSQILFDEKKGSLDLVLKAQGFGKPVRLDENKKVSDLVSAVQQKLNGTDTQQSPEVLEEDKKIKFWFDQFLYTDVPNAGFNTAFKKLMVRLGITAPKFFDLPAGQAYQIYPKEMKTFTKFVEFFMKEMGEDVNSKELIAAKNATAVANIFGKALDANFKPEASWGNLVQEEAKNEQAAATTSDDKSWIYWTFGLGIAAVGVYTLTKKKSKK